MLIRLDKLNDQHVYNMKVQENGVVNGAVVKKGDYDGYDYFKAEKNTDASAEELVMLVAPFMNYTGLEDETEKKKKNGYGDMVIMSMETFEGVSERLKMYQSLMISEEQMKEGKVKDARASLASVREKYAL